MKANRSKLIPNSNVIVLAVVALALGWMWLNSQASAGPPN